MASEARPAHQVTRLGGRGAVWEEELYALKRKVYTGFLSVAAFVTVLIPVLPGLELDPGTQPLAIIVIPLWLVVIVTAIVAMQLRPRTVVVVERVIYFAAYPLYVGIGAALMVTGDDAARQVASVHSTAQWLPAAVIWAYLAFGARRGLLAACSLLVSFVVAVNLGAAFGPHGEALAGARPVGALTLATNVVNILGLFVMWTFIELQSRGRAAAETLARFATVDSLTGLPNRRALEARLEHDLVVARRHRRAVAAYFVDLDDLKGVNDTYGHQGGDELITRYAERLRATVRAEDIVARISGDEFVVAGFVGGMDDAVGLARKLLGATDDPFSIAGDHLVEVGASIGVSLFPDHAEDAAGLLRKADVAMYAAKLSGKNGWRSASAVGADSPGALVTATGGGGTGADEVLRH